MRKRLGQHFLFDPSILRRIIAAAHLEPDDTVVEIGPGMGRLTKMLADVVREVVAIEIDQMLCERLRSDLSGERNIRIVCSDVLKYPFDGLQGFKVVSNIPYYITTPIIFKLISLRDRLVSATLTLQREVAERIVAGVGGKDYGVLSLMVQYYAEPEIAFIIPRGAFSPPPRVDSSVLHMDMLEKPRVSVSDEGMFFKVIKTAFSQRRKTLSNSLKAIRRDIKDILRGCGIDPLRRPETLTLEDFARVSEAVVTESHREGCAPSDS